MTESRNHGQAENSIPPLKLRFAGCIISLGAMTWLCYNENHIIMINEACYNEVEVYNVFK